MTININIIGNNSLCLVVGRTEDAIELFRFDIFDSALKS
jgi:hypothetical protein